MNKDWRVIILILLVVTILIGEAYCYIPNNYGYGSTATSSSNHVYYSIHSNASKEYDAILIDNGTYEAVQKVYIYYDSEYVSDVNENAEVEVGAPQMTQTYYLDQIAKTLKYRGITDITFVNAKELKNVLSKEITDNDAQSKGLIMASGTIPMTVFSGSNEDTIIKWISCGGSLFWIGNAIGKYVSNLNEEIKVDATSLFTGTEKYNLNNSKAINSTGAINKDLSFESLYTQYSINPLETDRKTLCSGYSDGTYSTVTFIELDKGQVCIIGGEFSTKQVHDVCISVCSGLGYCSIIISTQHGTVRGTINGSFETTEMKNNIRLYLYIGGYFCVYGKGYSFN